MTKILFSLLYKLESAFDRISIVRVSRKQCCCCYDMTSRPCRGWTGQSRGRERSSPAAPRLLAPRVTFTCNKECYVAYNKQMLSIKCLVNSEKYLNKITTLKNSFHFYQLHLALSIKLSLLLNGSDELSAGW